MTQLCNAGLYMVNRQALFWDKVFKLPAPGCWLWTAGKFTNGYGSFRDDTGMVKAHRYSFLLATGRHPADGMELDHICRVRHCVNPAHLREVTRKQNLEHLASDPTLRANNTSGYRGVTRFRDKWHGVVGHNGRKYRRQFDTAEEAAAWVAAKRDELFTHHSTGLP